MIRVNNVFKNLSGLDVLSGVSFEVLEGEFMALIGMSGTGKSVLLKHLAGLIQPDQGQIFIDGQDICKLKGKDLENMRNRFGFVFQNGALFDSKTVFENVAFPLREKTRLSRDEIDEKVRNELRQVGLTGAEEKYPAEISGGMIKRTALARAMVLQPKIMFFDEPTTGLDPIISKSILNLFDSCHEQSGLTGIIVSHDIPEIFDIVQKVAFLHEGTILKVGTPEEIQSSKNPIIQQFITGSTSGPIKY